MSIVFFVCARAANKLLRAVLLKKMHRDHDETAKDVANEIFGSNPEGDNGALPYFALLLRGRWNRSLYHNRYGLGLNTVREAIFPQDDLELQISVALAKWFTRLVKLGEDQTPDGQYKGIEIPSPDSEWMENAATMMDRAAVIFIVPGSGKAIRLELMHIWSSPDLIRKSVIVFPQGYKNQEANREVALGLLFDRGHVDAIRFCHKQIRMIHAAEFKDLAEANGANSSGLPEDLMRYQTPFRRWYSFGADPSTNERTMAFLLATIGADLGEDSPLWFYYEALTNAGMKLEDY